MKTWNPSILTYVTKGLCYRFFNEFDGVIIYAQLISRGAQYVYSKILQFIQILLQYIDILTLFLIWLWVKATLVFLARPKTAGR